jgi:hypothetical protein
VGERQLPHRVPDPEIVEVDRDRTLGSPGSAVYLSPGAVQAFAAAIARIPIEQCDWPNAETLLLLYGALNAYRRRDRRRAMRARRGCVKSFPFGAAPRGSCNR